jgi:hypothetical protein
MGEVKPENVYSGPNQRKQLVICVTGGSYSSYDLCTMYGMLDTGISVHFFMQVLGNVFTHNIYFGRLPGENLDDFHPFVTDLLFCFYRLVEWCIMHPVIHDTNHYIMPVFHQALYPCIPHPAGD